MDNENKPHDNIFRGDVDNLGAISNAIIETRRQSQDGHSLFKLKMNNKKYLVIYEILVKGMLKDTQGNYIYFKDTFISYIRENNIGKVELTILNDLQLKEEMISIMNAYALIG